MKLIRKSEPRWSVDADRGSAARNACAAQGKPSDEQDDELEALAEILDAAAARIASDPDEALLLLDGLLPRMIAYWLARRGCVVGGRHALLDAVAEHDDLLAYHARLALRAPNAYARLAACLRLFEVCFGAAAVAAVGL